MSSQIARAAPLLRRAEVRAGSTIGDEVAERIAYRTTSKMRSLYTTQVAQRAVGSPALATSLQWAANITPTTEKK
jgi:hypothetical protein